MLHTPHDIALPSMFSYVHAAHDHAPPPPKATLLPSWLSMRVGVTMRGGADPPRPGARAGCVVVFFFLLRVFFRRFPFPFFAFRTVCPFQFASSTVACAAACAAVCCCASAAHLGDLEEILLFALIGVGRPIEGSADFASCSPALVAAVAACSFSASWRLSRASRLILFFSAHSKIRWSHK